MSITYATENKETILKFTLISKTMSFIFAFFKDIFRYQICFFFMHYYSLVPSGDIKNREQS